MANISIEVMTADTTRNGKSYGHYEIKIFAGLDEDPVGIMQETLERVKASLQSVPIEKRYPKMPIMDC